VVLPRVFTLGYSIYFGLYQAAGQINSTESAHCYRLQANLSEHCFLNLLAVFLMLLALNFSWYDDPIAIIEQHEKQMQEIADREMQGPEDSSSLDVYQKPTMYIAKNSIEMHMLKSSSLMHAKRRSKLQKDTRRNYY
jgi:hypothetical protein